MSGKAPSEGTKVTAGHNAPTTHESAGLVASDSLAAESQSFRQSNQATPQHLSRDNLTSAPQAHSGGIHQHSSTTKSGQGDHNAPSYVQTQLAKDTSGPHGKNITEDESIGTQDKMKNASFSQFGTKGDPGRAAEKTFTKFQAANTGATGGGGREKEEEVGERHPYSALGGDTEA
ncbi:uncharacterized protein GGS25DRAFT_531769 [Hypoxylon fragiforme]|uniref:uncharacterized protein n=1 Tax=Hypoxylon fragiforme TaxID=63214 RepID=UPI0020C6F8BA|nr:uncharacterized protein GGS25DRAFT_531769 [Hypoxylon fragiforme]KAI2608761.1 hypothetical protein GGS25DRAFT_531769 [Hypoxylon fragiforme]